MSKKKGTTKDFDCELTLALTWEFSTDFKWSHTDIACRKTIVDTAKNRGTLVRDILRSYRDIKTGDKREVQSANLAKHLYIRTDPLGTAADPRYRGKKIWVDCYI